MTNKTENLANIFNKIMVWLERLILLCLDSILKSYDSISASSFISTAMFPSTCQSQNNFQSYNGLLINILESILSYIFLFFRSLKLKVQVNGAGGREAYTTLSEYKKSF